jgi:hypothetical protein
MDIYIGTQELRKEADRLSSVATSEEGSTRCYKVINELFREIGFQASARICLTMMEDYLPAFLSLSPNNKSFPITIKYIRRHILSPDPNFRIHWLRPYKTPGTSGFVSAVVELMYALENEQSLTEEQWADAFTDSIESIIVAWMTYEWGKKDVEQFARRSRERLRDNANPEETRSYTIWQAAPFISFESLKIKRDKLHFLAGLYEKEFSHDTDKTS